MHRARRGVPDKTSDQLPVLLDELQRGRASTPRTTHRMHIPKPDLETLGSTSEPNSDFARDFERKHPSFARELQHLVVGVKPQTLRPSEGDKTFTSLLKHVNLTHVPSQPAFGTRSADRSRTPESSDEESMSQTLMEQPGMDQTVIHGGSRDPPPGRGAHGGPTTSTMIQSPAGPSRGSSRNVRHRDAPSEPFGIHRTSTRHTGTPLDHYCDLLLPEGKFVSELHARRALFKTPLGREVLMMRCPKDLIPLYNDEALYICNVTGVILSGAYGTSYWSELTAHQRYCMYKPLASIPTPDLKHYPSVRPIGQREGAFPRWSFAPHPIFPVECYVDLSNPDIISTRFGSGYVVKYPVSKSGLMGETVLYLDPWIGDIYEDPQRAVSIRRDIYLAYEGGPLPYKSPRYHKTGPSMSAERPVATSKKNWYLPDGKKLGDLPEYVSDAISPRGNKVQAIPIPQDLASHFSRDATVAFYDEITAEVLQYNEMEVVVLTDIVASPRPPAVLEEPPKPDPLPPQTVPRSQQPGTPRASPRKTERLDSKALAKAEYIKMRKHLRKVEKEEQFVLAAISDPSRRHTAKGAVIYLRTYLGQHLDELVETYPELVKEVSGISWDEDLIPEDMPESLVERVTDMYNKEVKIGDLVSQVGDLTSLPSIKVPSSVKTADREQGIKTQEMKVYRRYIEHAAKSKAKAMNSYLQYFPEPANWQDPPPHPIKPVFHVGYRDNKIVQGLKETDSAKVPNQQLFHIDNIEDQRGKELEYPRNIHFDATGNIQLDPEGQPDLPLCARCYSPWHVETDCYVTQQIKERKLEVDEEGNPKSCRFCRGYQHSTKNCKVWSFYRRCLFCNGDHQTLNCPTRVSIDTQAMLAEANQTPVSCRDCTCSQLAAIPCYHGPQKEAPKGYHFFGMPCSNCSAKCICKYELRKDKYCMKCGDSLEGELHACYLEWDITECSLCSGTDHTDLTCRYFVYDIAGKPLTCQLCQGEDHAPAQCPDFKRELMDGQKQCSICLMTNHTHHSCPSALYPDRPAPNETYCPFCGTHSCDYHSCEREKEATPLPPPHTPARWGAQGIENWQFSPILPSANKVPNTEKKIPPPPTPARPATPQRQPTRTPSRPSSTATRTREPRQPSPPPYTPVRSRNYPPSEEFHRENTHGMRYYQPPSHQREPTRPTQPSRPVQPERDHRPPSRDEERPYRQPGGPPRGPGGAGGGNGDGDGDDSPSDDDSFYTTEDEMGRRIRRRRRRRRNDPLMETIVEVMKNQEGILREQQNMLRHVSNTTTFGGNTSLTEHQGNEIVEKLDVIADQATGKYLEQITTFDGKDKQKFDNWLYDVEIMCAKFHLEPLRTAFLRSSGNLRQYLGEFTQGSDWTKIREQLIFEFSANPTVHHVEVALHRMTQGAEGLATYCKNYSRMVNQAVYKSPRDITYPLEIARFIRSLRNDKLAEKVQSKKPKTLQEAMTLAQELEKPMREREALLQFRPHVVTGNSRKDKRVMAVNRRPEPHPSNEERETPPALQGIGEDEIAATVKEVLNIQQGKPSKNTECYRCGKVGHWSWQCDQQGKPQQGGPPPVPIQGRLNYSATGSLPLNEGLHELLATAFQKAEQHRKEKNKYKAAWKASQGNQNNPPQTPRKPPPKDAKAQQAGPPGKADQASKPTPRGGAKKFNVAPNKPPTKEVTNIVMETPDETDESEDLEEPVRMGTVQALVESDDESDASPEEEDEDPPQQD